MHAGWVKVLLETCQSKFTVAARSVRLRDRTIQVILPITITTLSFLTLNNFLNSLGLDTLNISQEDETFYDREKNLIETVIKIENSTWYAVVTGSPCHSLTPDLSYWAKVSLAFCSTDYYRLSPQLLDYLLSVHQLIFVLPMLLCDLWSLRADMLCVCRRTTNLLAWMPLTRAVPQGTGMPWNLPCSTSLSVTWKRQWSGSC